MTTYTDLTIERFETGDVDADGFGHEAHVYVAWLYLQAYPPAEAIARFDAALRRLVIQLGAESKYSAMITWLFMKLIAERMEDGEDWTTFRTRNVDLIDERPRAGAA